MLCPLGHDLGLNAQATSPVGLVGKPGASHRKKGERHRRVAAND